MDNTARLIMPPLPGDDSSAAYVLRDNLERVARYRNVLELRNPNPTSRLLGKVRLLVRRQAHDGRWTTLEPEPETSLPLLHEGERVGFEVAKRPFRADLPDPARLRVDGSIGQVYPSPPD